MKESHRLRHLSARSIQFAINGNCVEGQVVKGTHMKGISAS